MKFQSDSSGYRSTYAPEQPGSDMWVLNLGPQHPATHTTLRHVLELDGERVVSCTVHIGYLHSGFEKLGEHLNYNQYVTVTDRMNYVSPMANNICLHHAAEKLFGIEITPRAKAIRTILAELARIQDHAVCVGCSGLDLGGYTAFMYPFNARETLYDIFEETCGHRFTNSYTRVGGMVEDIKPNFTKKVKEYIKGEFQKALDDFERMLTRNRVFHERTKGIGYISKEDAINWSLTGPLARASGVKRDIRKDEPYLCYADNWDSKGTPAVDFKVPISEGGDCYARYLVRVAEMRESAKIVLQLIDNIPEGPVNVFPDEKLTLPDKREVFFSIEGMIHHFETVMTNRGFKPPIGEVYGCNESPSGELGFHIVSDGGNCPYRIRTRPPGLMNYQCFEKLVVGHQISDVIAVLSGMNIIAGELDR